MEKENERDLLVKSCKELLRNKSISIRTGLYGDLLSIYTDHLTSSKETDTNLIDTISYKIVICRQFETWLLSETRFKEINYNGTETGEYKLSMKELRYIIKNIDTIVYRTFSHYGLDITGCIDEYKWFNSIVSVFDLMMFEKDENINGGTDEN